MALLNSPLARRAWERRRNPGIMPVYASSEFTVPLLGDPESDDRESRITSLRICVARLPACDFRRRRSNQPNRTEGETTYSSPFSIQFGIKPADCYDES